MSNKEKIPLTSYRSARAVFSGSNYLFEFSMNETLTGHGPGTKFTRAGIPNEWKAKKSS
jgi:hypothetical protein